jgi:hypothetical protein
MAPFEPKRKPRTSPRSNQGSRQPHDAALHTSIVQKTADQIPAAISYCSGNIDSTALVRPSRCSYGWTHTGRAKTARNISARNNQANRYTPVGDNKAFGLRWPQHLRVWVVLKQFFDYTNQKQNVYYCISPTCFGRIFVLFSSNHILLCSYYGWPPLWSSGQSFWLQIQRSRVRFPELPAFLSSSGSGTGSTQPREPREVNWGATWTKNTMALGSTHPLTKMSTRNTSWG